MDEDAPGALAAVDWTVRTVLFIDIFESVRLMQAHESDVVARWLRLVSTLETEVLPPLGGQIVKSTGDGLMLQFVDVRAAIKAAFAMQHACESLNADLPAARHILLRIGAHVGHIIAGQRDVYGHDVNLAARLTTLAGPAEIVVSTEVREQIVPLLDAEAEDLGFCYLKNVQEPVRAYRIGPPGPRPVLQSDAAAMAKLRATIAVIPFTLRAAEPDHRIVGEILADEIISALSQSIELNVISRLSTTAFRDRTTPLADIGSLLHATYVLSGAYRISGNKLRLTADLNDVKSGTVIWSRVVEGHVTRIIEGNDKIVEELVADVNAAVATSEVERAQTLSLPTLDSYTLLLSAITLMHRLSREDFFRARPLLEALIERVPRQAVPWAWKAKWHVLRVQQGWSDDPAEEGRLALDCTRRALDADPQCSLALAITGLVLTNLLKRLDLGLEQYEQALRVNPNDSLAWLLKGTLHAFKGEGRKAVAGTRRALALSPLDPHRYFYDSLAATAALSAGQHKRAVELAQRSLRANRTHTSTLRALAIAQWQMGREDDARGTVRELLRLQPGLTITEYMRRNPSSGYETGRIWSNALREAGVPQ